MRASRRGRSKIPPEGFEALFQRGSAISQLAQLGAHRGECTRFPLSGRPCDCTPYTGDRQSRTNLQASGRARLWSRTRAEWARRLLSIEDETEALNPCSVVDIPDARVRSRATSSSAASTAAASAN